MGDEPAGGGLLISIPEAKEMLRADPRNAEVVKPFLNASNLFQEPRMNTVNFSICFQDWTLDKAKTYVLPFEQVDSKVRPVRESSNIPERRERWWLFGRYRKELRTASRGLRRVIVRPSVSETPL